MLKQTVLKKKKLPSKSIQRNERPLQCDLQNVTEDMKEDLNK